MEDTIEIAAYKLRDLQIVSFDTLTFTCLRFGEKFALTAKLLENSYIDFLFSGMGYG